MARHRSAPRDARRDRDLLHRPDRPALPGAPGMGDRADRRDRPHLEVPVGRPAAALRPRALPGLPRHAARGAVRRAAADLASRAAVLRLGEPARRVRRGHRAPRGLRHRGLDRAHPGTPRAHGRRGARRPRLARHAERARGVLVRRVVRALGERGRRGTPGGPAVAGGPRVLRPAPRSPARHPRRAPRRRRGADAIAGPVGRTGRAVHDPRPRASAPPAVRRDDPRSARRGRSPAGAPARRGVGPARAAAHRGRRARAAAPAGPRAHRGAARGRVARGRGGAGQLGAAPAAVRASRIAFPLGAAAGAFALAVTLPLGDPDMYWHLASGQWMLDHREILRSDVFSSTVAGQPYSVGEWLGEVVLTLVFNAAGWPGLAMFRALLAGTGAFALARLSRRGGAPLVAALLVVVWAIAFSKTRWVDRPAIFTFVLFPVVLDLLYQAKDGSRRALLAIPPLILLWANLHGGGAVGIALVLALAVQGGRPRAPDRRSLLRT